MSQRMNYNAVSPAGMKALGAAHGYIRQSGLPSRLVDLVFLGVSQINGWRRRDIDYVNALGAHTVVNFQTHPKGKIILSVERAGERTRRKH